MTYFGCMCCRHNRRDYVIGGPVQEDERPPIETISPESVWHVASRKERVGRSDLQATCDLLLGSPLSCPQAVCYAYHVDLFLRWRGTLVGHCECLELKHRRVGRLGVGAFDIRLSYCVY